jgi:glycine/D-amino acid oxidase-like deaminating enzyme
MERGSEILIVGAGIAGAATAWFLSRRGLRVTLVEARHPGWGSSGRNGGLLWLHLRKTGPQMQLARAGRALADVMKSELPDYDLQPNGSLIFFTEERHGPIFEDLVAERRAAGLPVELLGANEARRHTPLLPDRIAGASWCSLDAHQTTGALCELLTADAARHGAMVKRDVEVRSLIVESHRCSGVATADGPLHADLTILAAGIWSADLLEAIGVRLPLTGARMQVMQTGPAPFTVGPIVCGPTLLRRYAFVRELPSYAEDGLAHPLEAGFPGLELSEAVIQRPDGTLLLGFPLDHAGRADTPTVAGIALSLAVLCDRLPQLRELPFKGAWAGLVPETPDALPVIGALPGLDGLLLNTGHVFGNTTGPLSGRLIMQHLLDEPTDFPMDLFRPDRPALSAAGAHALRW